jgi:flagellar biosynthesis protein FliQ
MSDTFLLDIGRQALEVSLLVALPMLLASLVMGLLVSLVQVATSLQDATLTFVPKILTVALALLLGGHWMLGVLLDFTRHVFQAVPQALG